MSSSYLSQLAIQSTQSFLSQNLNLYSKDNSGIIECPSANSISLTSRVSYRPHAYKRFQVVNGIKNEISFTESRRIQISISEEFSPGKSKILSNVRDHPPGTFLEDDVGPNQLLLEAQGRVCTGPTQTKPLDESKMKDVLQTILLSVKGELPIEQRVSSAQMGAFFGAMTLRANSFPLPTQWSDGERSAMAEFWPELRRTLPHDILFLADPEGSIMGDILPIGPNYSGPGSEEESRLVGALRVVLDGGHLGFQETMAVLQDVLPLKGEKGKEKGTGVSDALVAAFLICQRMNKETDRELKAYCMAFDKESGRPVADVLSLTHYGDTYDGHTRFFRPNLFTACVRASYGESCLLHGVDFMPPKGGVTEEQMLKLMGANTNLSPNSAARMLEEVGLAYLSLKNGSPSQFSLVDLRFHIKKRPPFATSEKVQRFIQASGRESMIAGFYHEGYEEALLMLMRRRRVIAGLVVKGEEGSLCFSTRPMGPDAVIKGQKINHCSGFCPSPDSLDESLRGNFHRLSFSHDIEPSDYGFQLTPSPRTDKSILKNLEFGIGALRGEKGPAYDRIIFNAAMHDHLLGCKDANDASVAIERAKEAIHSGKALQVLENYVNKSLLF